jgi:acyl-CoA reductase-like NAD-dependent aldehyde dehydrogenase
MAQLDCTSPINGKIYASRETQDVAMVAERLKSMCKAQKSWAERPVSARTAIVLDMVDALAAHRFSCWIFTVLHARNPII